MKDFFVKKLRPNGRSFLFAVATSLFSFVAVTAGTLIRITIAGIAHVDGGKSTVLAVVIITATGNVATNAFVYSSFNHRHCPPYYLAVSNQTSNNSIPKVSIFY